MIVKRQFWEISFASILIITSLLLYYAHYLVFNDPHHIWIYCIGDLAFLPIEVLLVTLVIDNLLERRDKKQKLEKMNMVIGTYFSSLGTYILTLLSDRDPKLNDIRRHLVVQGDWGDADFARVKNYFSGYHPTVSMDGSDLVLLRDVLQRKEEFMIRLLENPVILEHESFTSLLQASFHLTEELTRRKELLSCCGTDHTHILGDIERVYHNLIMEWIKYMQYLKNNFPYLFSFAMRTNPFDEEASIEITK